MPTGTAVPRDAPQPAAARDPEWGHPRIRRRFAVFMYGFGAAVTGAAPLLPDPDPSDHVFLGGFAAALACGFLLHLVLPPSRALAVWSARTAVLCVSGLALVANPLGGVPYFYAWPILFAAMLLPRRELWLAAGLTVSTFGAALLLHPGAAGAVVFVGASGSAIGVGVVVRAMRDQRDALERSLRHAAATDALTGLPNRRAFDETLGRASQGATREAPMALVMLDVDRFKRINDQHGHAVGDASLRVVASALCASAPSAVAARIGGEEFALVMADADERDARRAVDALDRLLMDADPSLPPTVELSTSAGIVTSTGGIGREALLHVADEALYRAKAEGRGRAIVGRVGGDEVGRPGARADTARPPGPAHEAPGTPAPGAQPFTAAELSPLAR